ncbi:MAG: DUF3141 domain-containing protein [Pseudomonadota bacterium]
MLGSSLVEYWIDAAQRTVLFWDVMRERGNQFVEHTAQTVPHVLDYDYTLVMSGMDLPRPVNYGLVRITPPAGVEIDPVKRPFVVIDPRAGHGPGIGGFKADSEIGVAMRAGHTCYLIGFTPVPAPGQTIEDVLMAEVAFIEKVIALHPEAEGKPTVIGNCQGGWALMMLAAYRPDLCGPIIVAGAPLSYWAGVHGQNPMRYTGGALGGTWLTALTGDLGAGRFDGAWLVTNFESMNPANTLWAKQYTVYRHVDTEKPRYLGFEKYWGGYVFLNAEEMQWIADNLFVGNKLSTAEIETSDGVRLDFRNIRSSIVCFCSQGDNITPPQQALGWILDLYRDVDDIRACGQTIVYAVHPSVGHLGIFVSGGVAKKEHREFASNIDFIDCLPPGLYEAVLTEKAAADDDADPASTDYVARFETRTLEDIRALGANSEADERRFATAARLSEINKALYRTTLGPVVRSKVTPPQAAAMAELHPARLIYTMFSDKNPLMRSVKTVAERVRTARQAVDADNPYFALQDRVSDAIVASLDGYRDLRDAAIEAWFLATFANPILQAAVGLGADGPPPRARPGLNPDHRELVRRKTAEFTARMGEGGVREACIRAMLYIRMAEGVADERRFEVISRLRQADGASLDAFKRTVRDQFAMLLIDPGAAVAALPGMLANKPAETAKALEAIRLVSSTGDAPTGEVARRLAEIEAIFAPAAGSPRQKATRTRKEDDVVPG